jgi:hypothetical protein
MVEAYVGIICACLPSLRAFAKRYFPNLFVFNDDLEQRLTSFQITPGRHLTQPDSNSNASPARDGSTAITVRNPDLRTKPSKSSEFTIGGTQASSEDKVHSESENNERGNSVPLETPLPLHDGESDRTSKEHLPPHHSPKADTRPYGRVQAAIYVVAISAIVINPLVSFLVPVRRDDGD